jgi:predicted ATP-dependent serine protease
MKKKKIMLKCQRCLYIWEYGGMSRWVTSCPRCRTSVSINKNTVTYKTEEKKEASSDGVPGSPPSHPMDAEKQ